MPVQVWTDPNQWFGLMLCQMSDVKSARKWIPRGF
jgi:hypothetical protein